MDFSGANLAGFGVLVALAALLQIGLLVLLIVVLLDIRRFIGDAIPLMGRANRWLARREETE